MGVAKSYIKPKTDMKEKIGLPPGTLIYTGEYKNEPVSSNRLCYHSAEVIEERFDGYETGDLPIVEDAVNWFNIYGLNDQEVMRQLQADFNIVHLALEDALNTSELPKIEEFDEHLFVSLKMFAVKDHSAKLKPEHISIFLGKNFVLTLQEKKGDVFEGVRNRIRVKHGKIRSRGCDYLLFALLDTIVDNYFLVVDFYQNSIEELEDQILTMEEKHAFSQINELKKDLVKMRKYIQPLEHAILNLMRFESDFVSDSISHYFEDLRNHITHISVLVNEQQQALISLTELHISLLSHEMNQIMKVLTIVAAIFIPLTFLAGIYGMNFEYMPELSFKYAYPTLLSVMGVLAAFLLLWMKKRKWI